MSCFPLFLALYSMKSSCAIKTIKSVNKSDVTIVAVISQYYSEHIRGSPPEQSNKNSFLRHYGVNVWLYNILDELCTDLKMELR